MSDYVNNKSTYVQEIAKNALLTGNLQALISSVSGSNRQAKKAYKVINQFFERPIHSEEDVKLKKLFAAALQMASAKGLIRKLPHRTAAIMADFQATREKAYYKYGNKEITLDEVAEIIADKATTSMVTVAKRVVNRQTIEKGLNFCVDAISKRFPAAQTLKKYTPRVSQWAEGKVHQTIDNAAPVVKKTIKNTIKFVAKTAKRVASGVKSVFRKLFA